jgi:predicted  nucleic acid-binding Zn-ribbon protein
MRVNPKLQALLTLQEHDDAIAKLEAKRAELAPRFASLDAERTAAERTAVTTRAAVEREEKRQRELAERTEEFRRMNARALGHMDHIHKAREANAAAAQIDISRRALADAEAEMALLSQRLSALRVSADAAEMSLAELGERQAEARAALDAQRAELDASIADARVHRDAAARDVEPQTRVRNDRVRARRRRTAVYALRGTSCSNCDTAIPSQRRAALGSGGEVDVCESCGVLLYAEAQPQ